MSFTLPFLLLAAPDVRADELTELADRVRPSIVTLQMESFLGTPTGSGTGFVVSGDGLVVTNDHVAAAGPTVAIFPDGSRREVLGLLATDPEADVALLRIAGDGYAALRIDAPAQPVAVGTTVVAVGSPLGLAQTVTEGKVSAIRAAGTLDARFAGLPRTTLLQFTAAIAPGSSGSPVMTTDGNVVGVAVGGDNLDNIYFAIDAAKVRELRARAPADGTLIPLEDPARQGFVALGIVAILMGLAFGRDILRFAGEIVPFRRRRGGRAAR